MKDLYAVGLSGDRLIDDGGFASVPALTCALAGWATKAMQCEVHNHILCLRARHRHLLYHYHLYPRRRKHRDVRVGGWV